MPQGDENCPFHFFKPLKFRQKRCVKILWRNSTIRVSQRFVPVSAVKFNYIKNLRCCWSMATKHLMKYKWECNFTLQNTGHHFWLSSATTQSIWGVHGSPTQEPPNLGLSLMPVFPNFNLQNHFLTVAVHSPFTLQMSQPYAGHSVLSSNNASRGHEITLLSSIFQSTYFKDIIMT